MHFFSIFIFANFMALYADGCFECFGLFKNDRPTTLEPRGHANPNASYSWSFTRKNIIYLKSK